MNCALAALWLLSLVQEEKVLLKVQAKEGDKLTRIEKGTMKLLGKVTAGKEVENIDFEQRSSEKKTIEVLSVEDGKPTKVTYDVEEDVEEQKERSGTGFKRIEKPLHGKKVTVSLQDGKKVVEGAEGLDEETIQSLRLDDKFSRLYPKRPVAIGESWEVTGKDLQAAMEQETMDGKVLLKLLEVKEIDQRRCAILEATFDVKGKDKQGIDLGMKLNGEIVVWLDRGYTLRIRIKGTVRMEATSVQMKMEAEGPMEAEITFTVQ